MRSYDIIPSCTMRLGEIQMDGSICYFTSCCGTSPAVMPHRQKALMHTSILAGHTGAALHTCRGCALVPRQMYTPK
jgi:hypothetical protein